MTGTESTHNSDSWCMRRLGEHARADAPSMFALYGIYNTDHLGAFCGWGLQWPEDSGGAVLHDREDRSTWYGESAEAILADHELFADTRLVWL